MSDITNVIKEIGKGRNLEINLPKYMNTMMTAYYRSSEIRLSMNYYTYLTMEQKEYGSDFGLTELTVRLDKVIKEAILSEFDGKILEKAVEEIDAIRNQIISDMKVITLYADQFQIYEYIFNRMEGRFEEVEALPLNYSDEKLIQKLSSYIMQDSDRAVISQKITEIVSTLPVRLTKQRYYEIIKDSFLLFVGSERQALEDHIFMLKSSAALLKPEEEEIRYLQMDSCLRELEKADYETLSFEQYQKMKQKLQEISGQIAQVTNLSTLLIEVVNDVYILLLSMPYALADAEEVTICKEIMHRSQELSEGGGEEEELSALFERLEGKQERISEQITANAYLLDTLEGQKSLMESIMLDKIYVSLLRIEKLSSTSHFIELDAAADRTIVDYAYAEERAHKVIGEFAACFQNCSRRQIRSRMAASMMALPIFFKNMEEFKEYAKTALSSCSDAEEKRSSVILLKDMMENLM
ncbi:MAG: hypothetical protein OSJ62_03155 [Lachnospiraceae bacterium]|nr:hypothetical protein [Lachnospiraceae bacterium]